MVFFFFVEEPKVFVWFFFYFYALGPGMRFHLKIYFADMKDALVWYYTNSGFTFSGTFLGSILYELLTSGDKIRFPKTLIFHKMFHKNMCRSFPL